MKNETVEINTKGVLWHTTEEYRFLIDALDGTLAQVEKKDVVKSSSIRRVVTVKIPRENDEFEIFVKHHRLPWKEALKDLLHISKARNEWKFTHQISDLQIKTVVPLAMGEKRKYGLLRESYFISKRIPKCETLHEFVMKESEKKHDLSFIKWKRKLIKDLAIMLSDIHKKGIEHRDLHAGNILIEWINDKEYKLRLLDLDRAHIYPKLSFKKRMVELTLFNMFFTLFISRTDRLRFFKEYYRQDPNPWRGYQRGARQVEAKTFKMVNKLYRRRDRMCLRRNKYFSRFLVGSISGYCRKEPAQTALLDLLKHPEDLLDPIHSEPIKKASEKSVRKYPLKLKDKTLDVVIKSYQTADRFGRFKDLFRNSRAKRSWIAANALYQRKIPTSFPLACFTENRWSFSKKSYFISEFIPTASVLVLYFNNRFKGPLSKEERFIKKRLLTQFARFVRHIHELWIYHGDLKASNILIEETSPGEFQFYLIDLDHVKICCTINRFQRYRNLMQVNKSFLDRSALSMTDRLTFLKAYLGPNARKKRTLQRAWTVVNHLTTRRLRKTDKSFSA